MAAEGQGTPAPDDVLVVIPTLNEAAHIAACLASLRSDEAGRTARLVIADGGSTDGTVAAARAADPAVRIVANEGVLQSAGVNAAVAEAGQGARYLVRCDAHSIYPPGYVRDVVAALEARPDAASVGSVLDSTGEGCFARALAWVVDTPLGSGGSAHRGGRRSGWVDHAHHAGFRLDWFRRIGGYDPTFSHNEDAEYDVRLRAAGGKVWLAADLRVGYAVRPTPRGLARQYWNYGRGRARTVRKHGLRPRLRQMIPVVNLAVLLACAALGFVLPPLWIVPASYLALLASVSAAGAMSLRGACGLWAGPALAILHNAWGAGFVAGLVSRDHDSRRGP